VAAPANLGGHAFLEAGLLISIELQELHNYEFTATGKAIVKLLLLLGQGGEADVYLCQLCSYELAAAGQLPWGKKPQPEQVALKLLHPPLDNAAAQVFAMNPDAAWGMLGNGAVRFNTEHNILTKLRRSKFVVDSWGYGRAAAAGQDSSLYGFPGPVPCVLLEYLDKGSVWQQLEPQPGVQQPMPANQAHAVLTDVARALSACHNCGYIHRDVKPRNVLVEQSPDSQRLAYKLCDFGIALEQPRGGMPCPNDDTNGTLRLLPPEPKWMVEADTWGLGLLLLTCRTAKLPPELPRHRRAKLLKDLKQHPDFTHLLPIEWELLRLCLEPDGGKRPYLTELFGRATYFKKKFPFEEPQPCKD